ncbi:MAG: hypothetical protein OYH77_06715 [Pseudomonadota bacterium]|nr:hypothetical protein [Pseudomonadota bacterium]
MSKQLRLMLGTGDVFCLRRDVWLRQTLRSFGKTKQACWAMPNELSIFSEGNACGLVFLLA